eukprot:CFRG8295T1
MGLFSKTDENAERRPSVEERSESWQLLTEKRLAELSEHDRYFYVGLIASLLPYYKSDASYGINEHRKKSRILHNEFHMALFHALAERTQLPKSRMESLEFVAKGEVEKDHSMFSGSLRNVDSGTGWLVMQDLVCLCLISGKYDARSRTLIRRVMVCLGVEWKQVILFEENLAHMLLSDFQETPEEIAAREEKEKSSKWKKYAAVTGAAVGGGLVIGLTAGLAAPFIAAGAGVLFGASATAFLASAGGLVLITTLFGGAGATLTGRAMSNRKGSLKEFDFMGLELEDSVLGRDTSNLLTQRDLNVIITVTGLIPGQSKDNVQMSKSEMYATPWLSMNAEGEAYTVLWESEELGALSKYMYSMLSSKAIGMATTQVLSQTVLQATIAAVSLPVALLNVTDVIDNAWVRCVSRADQAALVLADTLCARVQGFRPVTLVGFGLGARMIFMALEDMAKRKVPAVGIVESVVLCGCPVPIDHDRWATVRSVVSGRFVNCYSKTDWILGYAYRALNGESTVAGMKEVVLRDVYGSPLDSSTHNNVSEHVGVSENENAESLLEVNAFDLIENVDVTHLVLGHLDYRKRMPHILYEIGLSTVKPPPLTEQEVAELKLDKATQPPSREKDVSQS